MLPPALPMRNTSGGCELTVLARPRARRTEYAGTHDGVPCIRLQAQPADGKANAELVRYLANVLAVPKTAVKVVRGASSRRKVLFVEGRTADGIARRLNALETGE